MIDNINNELFIYYKKEFKTHLSYTGPFEKKVLFSLGGLIRNNFDEYIAIKSRVFGIFVELVENVAHYSAEVIKLQKDISFGIGTIVLKEYENHYQFITGNYVYNEVLKNIEDKCSKINSMNRDDLREYKRMQRRLPRSHKGGANIGLIHIALLSSNPLDLIITEVIDNISFLSISAKIDKI